MTSPNAMPGTAASDEFAARLDENKGIVYKIAHSFARNVEDWKDLTQEITSVVIGPISIRMSL